MDMISRHIDTKQLQHTRRHACVQQAAEDRVSANHAVSALTKIVTKK